MYYSSQNFQEGMYFAVRFRPIRVAMQQPPQQPAHAVLDIVSLS